MAYYNQWDKNKTIKHPPLSMRMKVLEKYHEKAQTSNYIDALVLYKNTMAGLYKKFNPWLKVRYYNRESFKPKQEDYEEYE